MRFIYAIIVLTLAVIFVIPNVAVFNAENAGVFARVFAAINMLTGFGGTGVLFKKWFFTKK